MSFVLIRTAELKTLKTSSSHEDWAEKRSQTHWNFASQWCKLLVEAPPVPELLAMVRTLVENSFWTTREELNRAALITWLEVSCEMRRGSSHSMLCSNSVTMQIRLSAYLMAESIRMLGFLTRISTKFAGSRVGSASHIVTLVQSGIHHPC
jgi:hypothetical protein